MKRLVLSFVVTLITTNLPAYAVWEPQPPGIGIPNYVLWAMGTIDGGVIWAVADTTAGPGHPKFVRSTDAGASWKVGIVPGTAGFHLMDIFALDQNTAWVTSNNYMGGGGILKTTDGGTSWVQQHSGPSSWIAFFDAQDGVAVHGPLIYTTTDGGDEWEPLPPGNRPPYLPGEGVGWFSANNSRAQVGDTFWFGTSQGRIFKSKDRGHHWSVFETSLGPDACINGIAFADADNGLICSCLDSNLQASPSQLAKTTDGGETWTTLVAPATPRAASITDVPGSTGSFVMVSHTSSLGGSAYTIDHGMSWTDMGNERLTTVDIAEDTGIPWAGGYTMPPFHGGIYRWSYSLDITEGSARGFERSFVLDQNHPNPFNPVTAIEFSLPRGSQVILRVYDILGREVTTLVDDARDAGTHRVLWDASSLASGVYFYRIEANGWTATRAMTLAK